MTVLKHEMKINAKSLLIWTLCVGLCCFGCILLYTSMEDSIKGMSDSFFTKQQACCDDTISYCNQKENS